MNFVKLGNAGKMMRRWIFVINFVFILTLIGACRPSVKEQRFSGNALGTTYHIRIQGKGRKIDKRDIESLIARLNRSLSTYISGSLISRINRGDTLQADEHFRRVYEAAREVYEQTGGIYDPTVGILVNAWGFGPGKKIKNIEHDSTITDSLLTYVGFDMVRIDDSGYVRKQYPEIFIDFNSIAKGYVIDRIGDLIAEKGYENYLVELGGEVLARGKNIKVNRPWTVAVDYPVPGHEGYITAVALENEAIATSGNYRKYRVDKETGEKYVHTLNPFTGRPERSALLSASVIAKDCTTADAWATACMAAGTEKAKQFLTRHPALEGLLIYADSTGRLQVWHTENVHLVRLD